MLLELRVENYAVIDHAVAAFGPGLNLLTGETGAGKSILIDALTLLLGNKASAEIVRSGAEKAVVSCVFETTAGAEAILEENGIDSAGNEIILRREIFSNGKGRVFVDNQPATVAVLKLLAPELALVHAQSETAISFDSSQQRLLLDRYAAISTAAIAKTYGEWRQLQRRLDGLEKGEQDRLRMVDLWSFQRREIREAHIEAGEDARLETEKRVLANAEKLISAARGAYDLLYESTDSALSKLSGAVKHVEELAKYDPKFAEYAQQLATAQALIEDSSSALRDYAEGIQSSPERLAEIEDRLATLDKLKRKYAAEAGASAGSAGASSAEKTPLEQVVAFGEEVERKLAEVENRDELLAQLTKEVAAAAEQYRVEARELTAARTTAAAKLEKVAEGQINDLAMKSKFQVHVSAEEGESSWSAGGWDVVECRIATNPGEPMKPLGEIASGGEMSRVLLALKVSVEEGARGKKRTALPRTLVFDEIDIGIGGRAAEAVGQKLKALAKAQQVLCITHLPQIAAFANQHFVIEKKEHDGRTKTSVRLLEHRERAEEIARMLSGAQLTQTSIRHAEQLLKSSGS